jgi:hypothetical protein
VRREDVRVVPPQAQGAGVLGVDEVHVEHGAPTRLPALWRPRWRCRPG